MWNRCACRLARIRSAYELRYILRLSCPFKGFILDKIYSADSFEKRSPFKGFILDKVLFRNLPLKPWSKQFNLKTQPQLTNHFAQVSHVPFFFPCSRAFSFVFFFFSFFFFPLSFIHLLLRYASLPSWPLPLCHLHTRTSLQQPMWWNSNTTHSSRKCTRSHVVASSLTAWRAS